MHKVVPSFGHHVVHGRKEGCLGAASLRGDEEIRMLERAGPAIDEAALGRNEELRPVEFHIRSARQNSVHRGLLVASPLENVPKGIKQSPRIGVLATAADA